MVTLWLDENVNKLLTGLDISRKKFVSVTLTSLFLTSGFLLHFGPLSVTKSNHHQALQTPIPVPANGAPAEDYWMAGAICHPFYWRFATEVSVIIKTPSQAPSNDRWYWFGLSCWDSNWSYDQVGFGEHQDEWRFYYSRSVYLSDGTLKIIPKAPYKLQLGVTYKYLMKINSGGVYFKLYKKVGSSWLLKKSIFKHTGGTGLFVTWRITTNYGDTYYSFTNWEETTPDSNPAPPFDIKFIDTRVDGFAFNSWWDFYAGSVPSGIHIRYGWEQWPYTQYVLVDNP